MILLVIKIILVESNIFSEMNLSNSKIVYLSLIIIFIIHVNILSETLVKLVTRDCLRDMRVSFAFQRSKIRNV